MGAEPPAQSSSDSDSSGDSESDSSGGRSFASSDSDSSDDAAAATDDELAETPAEAKSRQRFSVTSSESGLRLKIAAIPSQAPSDSDDREVELRSESESASEKRGRRTRAHTRKTLAQDDSDRPIKPSLPKPRANLKRESRVTAKRVKKDARKSALGKDSSARKSPVREKAKPRAKVGAAASAAKRPRGRPPAKMAAAKAAVAEESSCSSRRSGSSRSCSSSDTDSDTDSNALAAACSLQVINEEDLAAILPEHQPGAAFGDFGAAEARPCDAKAPHENDGSSSEMELPPQLVNAAIQRATAEGSGSDDEEGAARDAARSSATHYASALLQQFVAQTQLLSHTASTAFPPEPSDANVDFSEVARPPAFVDSDAERDEPSTSQPRPAKLDADKDATTSQVKKKRGRPRKVKDESNQFCRANEPPNVSPDSGILSNHNSPAPSPHRAEPPGEAGSAKGPSAKRSGRSKSKSRASAPRDPSVSKTSPKDQAKAKKSEKLDIAALDRMLYATDRVLYPPRRKAGRGGQSKRGPGRPPKNKPSLDSEDTDDDDDLRSDKGLLSEVYAKRKDINKLVNSISKKSSGKNLTDWRDVQSDNETVADDPLDPMWREIDLNPKYRDIISGYKSDHEVGRSYKVCSRSIESGYKSDYGFKSGYKSDHYCKSGYKSDHKSGYKSDKSGYKSDYSIRNIRRRMRKLKKSRSVRDRSYYKNQKYFVSDQDIILLANKTLSCLTLGHSSSDSESENRSQNVTSKFTSPRGGGPFSAKFTFANRFDQMGNVDLFAPAPVFGGPASRSNIFSANNRLGFGKSNRNHFGSLYPTSLSAFTHKFACPPMATSKNDSAFSSVPTLSSFHSISNNNSSKQSCRNLSPKSKKSAKTADSIYPIFKKEKSPLPVVNIFQQSQSAYVPNKSLSRNIFLNVKKPQKKTATAPQWKKHKTQLILTPAKPSPDVAKSSGRLSRMSNRSADSSRHRRHKSRKHKRRGRSRSASRSRDNCTKSISGSSDQKFNQEMDNLIGQFVKLCHNLPKPIEKIVPENIVKCTKRTSKKRKGPDGAENSATPTSKRRHKKQTQESQAKGGKDKDTNTNEHKLPLKKRHYHINSSTNNSLSLSLVATEYVESLKSDSAKGADSFVCTETNCLGDLKEDSVKEKVSNTSGKSSGKAGGSDKAKKDTKNNEPDIGKSMNNDQSSENVASGAAPSTIDDDSTKKPADQSEFSKKIHETSEKLKAVHKMVNDLEKSLPKSKENDNSPIASSSAPSKNSPPIVTPKKRHRLEADRLLNSELNSVVQSLAKKLSEDKNDPGSKLLEGQSAKDREGDPENDDNADKSNKNAQGPAQKSEIITRKKNRLEGLTSNLVSKINPGKSSDLSASANLRKSIESRIFERTKSDAADNNKREVFNNTRATVIKSPISKLMKLPAEAKKLPKGTDILIEETVVVDVDKPTGIFEPSVDIELQIPKSSISVSQISIESSPKYGKSIAKNIENKINGRISIIDENKIKKIDSIAAVISERIMENGHNLRASKRNQSNDVDERDKKKRRNIGRDDKLKVPANDSLKMKDVENTPTPVANPGSSVPVKKKAKRRKAINRTGFPSAKKKKKKLVPTTSRNDENFHDNASRSNLAFERVPKAGEATDSFLERTTRKSVAELKVVLNKEDCPKRGRVSVIALERLQGKGVENAERSSADTVAKWETLSETDGLPQTLNNNNDPEDSIPLSLLNLKSERPNSRLDVKHDRLKRKMRDASPADSLDDIVITKRAAVVVDRRRSKSSLAVPIRRSARSHENAADSDDTLLSSIETKINKPESGKSRKIERQRSSRSRRPKEVASSRESSLESVKPIKKSPKSRDASVETVGNSQESCSENEPLPLQEKEIDFERSIDLLSKSVVGKKRIASSRDDSPASSVERGYRSERDNQKRNPQSRKKYLVAGLFSNYYKEAEPKPIDHKSRSTYNPSDHPNGPLPAPPYCERWVRRRKRHFALPYDIWWRHQYNKPVPSWNYRKIRTNVYYDVKPTPDGCESQACNCKPSSECQDDCINRLVYAECSPQLCPCKDACKNQRIQRHAWAPALDKFMTENKGWGIRTKLSIASGDFILEYVGEVVSDKEFKDRMATRYTKDTHHYCLNLDGGLVIDGHRMGGEGRFVNHSCQPNCEMQKWSVDGLFRMALFALRDIEPGEELTYDYNFSLFNPTEGQPCKCDSENCRGVIGGKSQRIAKQALKSQGRSAAPPASPVVSNSAMPPQNPQNRVGRPRKAVKANIKSTSNPISSDRSDAALFLKEVQSANKFWQEPQIKPPTAKEKITIKDRHCFLLRNLDKVRRMRERFLAQDRMVLAGAQTVSQPGACQILPNNSIDTAVIAPNSQPFAARSRTPRNAKTRRPAQVEDDVELDKHARLLNAFRELYNVVVTARDEKNEIICTPILRKKGTDAAESTQTPPDLSTIEANIEAGRFENVAAFDSQFNAFFVAIVKTFGRTSAQGVAALRLRKLYSGAKLDFAERLANIVGPEESLPPGFVQKRKQEEVIMCICGLHGEEGLMVQCGGENDSNNASDSPPKGEEPKGEEQKTKGCGVWQHARCMRVTDVGEPYYCHRCLPREVVLEIPLDEYTDDGHQFYLSLLRGNLQVRQGDTVYVLRDIPIDEKHPDRSDDTHSNGLAHDVRDTSLTCSKSKRLDRKLRTQEKSRKNDTDATGIAKKEKIRKHTYKTIGAIGVTELDIFRVERLWKDRETGQRYVYGHHYLRPHETYHEPTRKFFPNEVMRVPLYEAVPIELVMSQCWVMDLNTYCKGRPLASREEHVYICELRVDKCARLFTKISKPKYPVCTKSYAFEMFPQRLKVSRTYAPHEVSPSLLKNKARKGQEGKSSNPRAAAVVGAPAPTPVKPKGAPLLHTAVVKNRTTQKTRLNGILLKLLSKMPTKQPLDVSYLLDGRRQRKKIAST